MPKKSVQSVKNRSDHIISKPEDLRRLLLDVMVGVVEGKVAPHQAMVITGLASEVHKSVRQEWDMHVYATEKFGLREGRVIECDAATVKLEVDSA